MLDSSLHFSRVDLAFFFSSLPTASLLEVKGGKCREKEEKQGKVSRSFLAWAVVAAAQVFLSKYMITVAGSMQLARE